MPIFLHVTFTQIKIQRVVPPFYLLSSLVCLSNPLASSHRLLLFWLPSLVSSICSPISYKWNYIVYTHLRVASFTQHSISEIQLCSCVFLFIIVSYFVIRICHNLSVFLLVDICIVSDILLLFIKLLWTFLYMLFCEHRHSFSLDIYLELEWLGSSVGICLALVETAKLPKGIYQFILPFCGV